MINDNNHTWESPSIARVKADQTKTGPINRIEETWTQDTKEPFTNDSEKVTS